VFTTPACWPEVRAVLDGAHLNASDACFIALTLIETALADAPEIARKIVLAAIVQRLDEKLLRSDTEEVKTP
jgi:hypothetical protein